MQLNLSCKKICSENLGCLVWSTRDKHNKQCGVVLQGMIAPDSSGVVQLCLSPVLSQFHDDVSSRGEDNEGHSQHGAANTQLFYINT